MTGSSYLFVYGTLLSGADNRWSRLLAEASRLEGRGCCRGLLFRIASYPGMILAEGERWVRGEVYRLNDPQSTLPVLDEYEGCGPGDPTPHEFERRIAPVFLDDGRVLESWVYLYCLDVAGKPKIASGDYLHQ